ncbi:hypothetical protein CS022_16235 [Veronia nyctiphanis]|uniref:HTH lysR-type domain-containing protein n=1 Tax=Veronia nyctiphanis TaxID=1278244 RepID=A0A4Q0YN64_9GAMM|nr:LysR family transcriptional regulator [Veronia nyctiphanis]RXJ72372.1 hypothetical protein CS022_16235 [Veronia nyctiphanis]
MMKISRYQIIAFAAVGRERSFSKAARALGVSQSTVTQHIQAMEEALGIDVFVRSSRGTELTAAGRDLFEVADQLQSLENRFNERATAYMSGKGGMLNVFISTSYPAMRMLAPFQAEVPDTCINIRMAPWKIGVSLLRNREVDVGIFMAPENCSGLACIPIEQHQFVSVLPETNPLSLRKQIRLKELEGETFIRFHEESYTRQWVDKKCLEYKVDFPTHNILANYEMMQYAVRQGLGVSIALRQSISPQKGLVCIAIEEFSENHTLCAVAVKQRAGTGLVGRLLASLKQQLVLAVCSNGSLCLFFRG